MISRATALSFRTYRCHQASSRHILQERRLTLERIDVRDAQQHRLVPGWPASGWLRYKDRHPLDAQPPGAVTALNHSGEVQVWLRFRPIRRTRLSSVGPKFGSFGPTPSINYHLFIRTEFKGPEFLGRTDATTAVAPRCHQRSSGNPSVLFCGLHPQRTYSRMSE